MFPSLALSAFTVTRFVSYSNVHRIDERLQNEPELVILCTFPTFASAILCSYNFTRAHIHYGSDGLLASNQHDRMLQVAEQRFSDSVSTRINYY